MKLAEATNLDRKTRRTWGTHPDPQPTRENRLLRAQLPLLP